jgi:hypothetical protein
MGTNRTSESIQHDEVVARLQLQLHQVLHKSADLELQMLNSRDFALGQAVELGELRMRLQQLTTDNKNHLAHIERLESALAEVAGRAHAAERYRHQLTTLHASTTWRIGRFVMLPVRFLKRFARRS